VVQAALAADQEALVVADQVVDDQVHSCKRWTPTTMESSPPKKSRMRPRHCKLWTKMEMAS
jgi:hypothetical protein